MGGMVALPGPALLRTVGPAAHSGVVAHARWLTLSPRTRRVVVALASIEGALKVVALIDLARRPSAQVRGPKVLWAAAIVLVNSAGALPLAYLTRARLAPPPRS